MYIGSLLCFARRSAAARLAASRLWDVRSCWLYRACYYRHFWSRTSHPQTPTPCSPAQQCCHGSLEATPPISRSTFARRFCCADGTTAAITLRRTDGRTGCRPFWQVATEAKGDARLHKHEPDGTFRAGVDSFARRRHKDGSTSPLLMPEVQRAIAHLGVDCDEDPGRSPWQCESWRSELLQWNAVRIDSATRPF